MLARRMLEVYVPKAERRKIYADKVPGIMARLQAAELVAKRIGLIDRNVFSISSGFFIREYRKNLAIMKLISHTLYQLELEGWIKAHPNRIYFLERKDVQCAGQYERHQIFDVIAETVKEVGTVFRDDFARRDAAEIKKACADLFVPVRDLSIAKDMEMARKKTFWERHDISPITRRAAMDIAASGYFYVENKKIFERGAAQHIIRSGDEKIDNLRAREAQEFDQYLDTEIAKAKELTGGELRAEFSLGPADRSPLFPGRPAKRDAEFKRESREIARTYEKGKARQARPYDVTFVISDIHLQDYVHRDIYELLRLLHVVVATGGTLVINGDFLDTWRAKNVALIIRNNKLLIDALRKVKRVVLIKGNHDGWLELFNNQKLLGDNVSVVDRLWMKNLHIEHGNFYDRFNSEESWIGKLATRAVNGIERNKYFGPQFLTWTEYVAKRILPDSRWAASKIDRIFLGIKNVYERRDPKEELYSPDNPLSIVFGHYHFPALFHAYDKINELVAKDRDLQGKVRFFFTDSWYNSEGYAGQVTVFAKAKRSQTDQMLTSTFLWEYIDAKKILTLYGAWKF